jgi:tetratricopeptide (TPR) repeat protein
MSQGWLYAKTKNDMALAMAGALLVGKNAKADKEANLIKGLYYSSIGDKQKAITFFDNCLALDYTFMFAYREKGITLYEMGKYEEALKVLDKAVTLQNKFDEGYYWMGRCFEKLNKTSDAIESYKTALLYNPDFVEAKDALAKLK